jgi:hypothetical protein
MVEKLFLLLKKSFRKKSLTEGIEPRTHSTEFRLPYLRTTISHNHNPIV